MITASILQLIMPFLTQSLVDTGIRDSNFGFITLVLIAQLIIFIARLSVDFIRSWILLHTNTRINIALVSDFLAKLMRLPLRFFDTKMVGDIMQRIGDHHRIETFLTGQSINTLFSFVNFIVFGFVLAYYDLSILGLFLLGNGLYVAWILFFMKYRRELDIKRFSQAAGEQSNIIQLITGMQEIKLNNCETEKRRQWERIQVKLFKISIKVLALEQYQQLGSVFFSQTTNILISFIAARSVVTGDMTLGMMMSLTYIVGQLSSPIEQFIGFARAFQDARISLERLGEIHQQEDEEHTLSMKTNNLPANRNLKIENLSFSYDGADRDYVLEDVNLTIPEQKVTAIVGASGSGKTTLIKLLLGFYDPNKGSVKIGDTSLQNINPHVWRSKTGSVMQDGFIFSDTIAKNIAIGAETIDRERLLHAVTVLVTGSCFFKYPDVIVTEMTLTGRYPVAPVVSRASGKISMLYVRDGQDVGPDSLLAVIENPARTEDVLKLKVGKEQMEDLALGEIQPAYSAYLQGLHEYENYYELNYYRKKIAASKEQIGKYRAYYGNLERQQKVVEAQHGIAGQQYERDSLLFARQVISPSEHETSRSTLLQSLYSLESGRASLENLRIQIGDLETNVLDMELQQAEKERLIEQSLRSATEQLTNAINSWELTYCLTSPIHGKVTFTKYWNENQYIPAGETVFTIVPVEEEELVGKALLPIQRSGKVKTGQRVIIRFANYPDQEFGIVNGVVNMISLVPTDNNYQVEINLPNGLTTNYGKTLPVTHEMKASAEIVTEDLRLIERFIMPFKRVLKEGIYPPPYRNLKKRGGLFVNSKRCCIVSIWGLPHAYRIPE